MKNFFDILRSIVTRRGFFAILYFVYPANAANSASTAYKEIDKFILRQLILFLNKQTSKYKTFSTSVFAKMIL